MKSKFLTRLSVMLVLVSALGVGTAYATESSELTPVQPKSQIENSLIRPGEVRPMSNHTDTSFYFEFNESLKETNARRKDTDSSIYIYTKEMTNDHVLMYVEGGHSATSVRYECDYKNGPRLLKLGKYRLRNYVHERGYSYTKLFAQVQKKVGYASGVWSPDCLGKYPFL